MTYNGVIYFVSMGETRNGGFRYIEMSNNQPGYWSIIIYKPAQ